MRDEDYIKAGVGLTDGFEYEVHFGQVSNWIRTPEGQRYPDTSLEVRALIAEQLVRQVDHIHHYEVVAEIETSRVREWAGPEVKTTTSCTGYDRTMNTIKCIVDSKVLTKEKA